MSYKKKIRIRILLFGLTALFLATVMLGFAFREGIEFYRVPTQILTNPPDESKKIRMGGLVVNDSVVLLEDLMIKFGVTDSLNTITVFYDGIIPDLFSEGEGVVVLGTFNGEVFEATQVLAKHDETYMPKEVIKALEKEGIFLQKD